MGNSYRLKKKFSTDGIELVSDTHEFKLEPPDGKKHAADLRYMKHWYEFYSQRIVNFQQTVEEIEKVNLQQPVEEACFADKYNG